MLAIIVNDPIAFQSKVTSIVTLLRYYELSFKCMNWAEFILSDKGCFSGLAILNDTYHEPSRLSIEQNKEWAKWQTTGKPCFIEYTVTDPTHEPIISKNPYWRMIINNIQVNNKQMELLQDIKLNSLLEVHQTNLLESNMPDNGQVLAVLGRVIGTHFAELGIPNETKPILVQKENTVWCAMKISDFDRMEFRPKQRWAILWRNLLKFLYRLDSSMITQINQMPLPAQWTEESFQKHISAILKDESLQEKKERYKKTVGKGIDWFLSSGILADEGKNGVYEGFKSTFDENGRMPLFRNYYLSKQYSQRADCTVDTALAFYLTSLLKEDPNSGLTSELLNKCAVISDRIFAVANKEWQYFDKSICRGLFGWFNDPYDKYVFYSDDNGRCAFSYHLYALLSKKPELIQRSLAATIALNRTHGKNGHRYSRLELHHLYKFKGRKYFEKHKIPSRNYTSPHYEANTFTALLYGGWMTRNPSLVKLITKGIADYSKNLNKMRVEQSSNDDISKLLIACSFLVGMETSDSKIKNFDAQKFLQELLQIFKKLQESNGAVPERDLNHTRSCKEKTNASYGTIEASVYRSNNETITDQLYSTSFLLWGFYFAWKLGKSETTRDEARDMCLKLADYLCAIQIESLNPQTNGAWMRAFDYSLGEYYGSNGDTGWGAYSIESGWMVAVILSGLLFIILELDPLKLIDADLRDTIDSLYKDERKIQDEIDIHWRENTPTPPKRQKPDNSFQNVVV